MVDNASKNYLNKKRGISTIVGGMIFLVLLTAGFSTFFLAMDVQSDTIDAQLSVSDSIIDKTQEQFTIAASTDESNSNRLGIQLKNLGSNPVNVESIWIINNSGNFPAQKFDVDYSDANIPGGYGVDILEHQPLFMTVDDYDIKVVSDLGTVKKVKLDVGGSNNLRATLLAIPPNVHINSNVTLTLHVENIGSSTLLNVKPAIDLPNMIPAFDPPNPPAPSPVDLDPGESNFFTWNFIAKGGAVPEGTTVDFDVSAIATEEDTGFSVTSNTAYSHVKMLEPIITEIIVLNEDLFSRPEIFLVIPGPFGDGPEKGMWGANIVNPTGQDMYVSKLVLTLLSPRAQSLDRVFSSIAGADYCEPEAIAPTPDNWSCPENNELVWKDLDNPVRIPPYSVFPFLAKVHADRLAGGTDTVEALIVNGNVFTTVGEFSKAGYSSSMDNNGNSYVNVYLSDVPHSTNSADIKVNQTVGSGLVQQFNVVIADFEIGGTEIHDSSKLIINMPKGWTVDSGSITGFGDFVWNYQSFSDTSSQIIADFSSNLVDGGRTIQFDATAPVVGNEQMYVMYILADGKTTDQDFSLSSVTEAVLKVTP